MAVDAHLMIIHPGYQAEGESDPYRPSKIHVMPDLFRYSG